MNRRTEARLAYGGLLFVVLILVRVVAGWYGLFESHSPDRALAAEIEGETGLDVLFVLWDEEYFEGKTLIVHILTGAETDLTEVVDYAASRSPSVFYLYGSGELNSSDDGSLQNILYTIGFTICFSSDDCANTPRGEYVGGTKIGAWWFGYEKTGHLWVKSERNILVVLEKLFKPEMVGSEQLVEE